MDERALNDNHVLNCLLPDERHYCYNLRDRAHNRELRINKLKTEDVKITGLQLFNTFTFYSY